MKKGKVLAVNISKEKGTVKNPVESAMFLEDFGMENDAHAGKWHRQVSMLAIESFEKMIAMTDVPLTPGVFAENLTTEGIVLFELPVGTIFEIGETRHELTQIGKKCHTGCEISKLVGKCVMPKEGIFTRVLKGGIIKPGDVITVLE